MNKQRLQNNEGLKKHKVAYVTSLITILGVLVLFGLMFISPLMLLSPGKSRTNTAKAELEPIMTIVEGQGLEKICGQGDNGYSIANTAPWFDSFAVGENEEQAVAELTNWLLDNGWKLGQRENLSDETLISATRNKLTFTMRKSAQDKTCSWDALSDENYPSTKGYSLKITSR